MASKKPQVSIRIEPSRTRKRVWLKAVDKDGLAGILNIARVDIARALAELEERLRASGLYRRVVVEPIPDHTRAPRRKG